MFFSKSSIDQILGIDSCVVSIFNDVVDKVSNDERLTKRLWEGYFYDTDELVKYTEGLRDVYRYTEFDDYLMELIRDTPDPEGTQEGNQLDLEEMSGILSIIDSDTNLCSLIEKYQSEKLCSFHSRELLDHIIEEYLLEIDSHEFNSDEELQLWELLETEDRIDEFLYDSVCVQDKIEYDESAIQNYVDEKLREKKTIDEMKHIVQLCLSHLNDGSLDEGDDNDDDYSDSNEEIYGYDEDEE
jgi:hypothetical protein